MENIIEWFSMRSFEDYLQWVDVFFIGLYSVITTRTVNRNKREISKIKETLNYIYGVRSESGTILYVGLTSELGRRRYEILEGSNEKYLPFPEKHRRYGWDVVELDSSTDINEARDLEKYYIDLHKPRYNKQLNN